MARAASLVLLLAMLGLIGSASVRSHAGEPAATPIARTEAAYLMRCGGCHGVEGVSVPGLVPTLRDQVGIFACTAEGRDYMLRVPNVAMSRIDDDGLLAAVMNFVVFRLGGASTPARTLPYTAAQVHAARGRPFDSTDIEALRAQVMSRAIQACAAPSGAG